MMERRQRYTIQRVDVKVTHESAKNADEEYDPGAIELGDIESAVAALDSNYWDNIDERDDVIICYPADYHQDIRTGDYESHQIIIKGKEKDLERLMWYYRRKRNER